MFIPFTKMHGLGNDYVVVDERDEILIPESKKSDFSQQISPRGTSVGSDGVLFLSTPENENLRMRIFNADGSEAESCGNGLRCAAFFHHGIRRSGKSEFSIDLPLAGRVKAWVEFESPTLANVRLELESAGLYEHRASLKLSDRELTYHRIDVGNPHAVFFLDENSKLPDTLDELDLSGIGDQIQTHTDFENTGGINAEFVTTDSGNSVTMRVHERGVGPTASCGTGCIAIARACAETERDSGWIEVKQPGGSLKIQTEENYLEGPAEHAYDGQYRFRDKLSAPGS